jgi:hypothetical protein
MMLTAALTTRQRPPTPWSPDLTPNEKRFSKVKEFLRSVAARTTEAVSVAMGDALRAVRLQDIVGWFGSCGRGVTKRLRAGSPSRLADRRRFLEAQFPERSIHFLLEMRPSPRPPSPNGVDDAAGGVVRVMRAGGRAGTPRALLYGSYHLFRCMRPYSIDSNL